METSSGETIFIGSSSEGRSRAEAIARLLRTEFPAAQVRGWWHAGVFRNGETFIESLVRESEAATAAVFVFTPDDRAGIREQEFRIPRDNVLFEYGLFVGSVTRHRVALVQVDGARLPSDLLGVKVIQLQFTTDNYFLEDAKSELSEWMIGLPARDAGPYPLLREKLRLLAPTLETLSSKTRARFDHNAARLMETTFLSALTDSQGVNAAFVELAELQLANSVSISACDATGPSGWVGPAPYRYIATQVREYLFANRVKDEWRPYVHDWLHAALARAIANARRRMSSGESSTRYDNPGEIAFQVGAPRLQYSRILLWTEDELADPLAGAVISLHEAFRIPLFFIKASDSSPEKQVAYVVFEKRDGGAPVIWGDREHHYDTTRATSFRKDGAIPTYGNALNIYRSLLERDDLMLAMDARELLVGRN